MSIDYQKPKPIIFCDFDGVLCYDRFWRNLSPSESEKVQEYLFRDNIEIVNDWMKGKYSSEEINQMISEKTKIPFDRLWDIFVNDCKTMSVSVEALEKLNKLRDRYVVILITGNMDSFTRFTQPATNLNQYFDKISNSFHEGLLKTDQGGLIFIKYIEEYGALVNECYVLDDSKQINSIFASLGGKACLVTKDKNVIYHLDVIAGKLC